MSALGLEPNEVRNGVESNGLCWREKSALEHRPSLNGPLKDPREIELTENCVIVGTFQRGSLPLRYSHEESIRFGPSFGGHIVRSSRREENLHTADRRHLLQSSPDLSADRRLSPCEIASRGVFEPGGAL